MDSNENQFEAIEKLFNDSGFTDYKWINPNQIVTAQWVRMKCMYGCSNYGQKATCPPHVPSVIECERFFREYNHAVVFHFSVKFENPDNRCAWYKKMTLCLVDLEKRIFLSGFEKSFLLMFGTCSLCTKCTAVKALCKYPEMARPAAEAFGVDVYSTVKKIGYPISVRTEQTQTMDRYVILMIQ